MRPDWSKPSFFPANRDGLSQTKLGGTMKALNKRIEQAIATRMEPKGWGENPDELVKTDSGVIHVTPKELDKIIRMKRCIRVSVYIKTDGYTQESIDEGKYYPDVFTKYLGITKKQAKELAKDMIKDAEEYSSKEDKLIEIRLSAWWSDDGSFSLNF